MAIKKSPKKSNLKDNECGWVTRDKRVACKEPHSTLFEISPKSKGFHPRNILRAEFIQKEGAHPLAPFFFLQFFLLAMDDMYPYHGVQDGIQGMILISISTSKSQFTPDGIYLGSPEEYTCLGRPSSRGDDDTHNSIMLFHPLLRHGALSFHPNRWTPSSRRPAYDVCIMLSKPNWAQ